MTEVVVQSPSHFPSPQQSSGGEEDSSISSRREEEKGCCREMEGDGGGGGGGGDHHHHQQQQQLSLLTFMVAALRKSWIGCSNYNNSQSENFCSSMEIGWPSNVRHVAHVTFDRFNGFLGLPVEFEPEVPRRAPSASTNVFGVSTESMQLSFDSKGNSVPTILLLMQRRLYERGGLQAEGIFRINADNSQEEYVREQLNRGVVPDAVDVHCLAGLIKAWFRELPSGLLDSLSSEQVMQSQSEEECVQLVRLLPPTEAALLDWAVNLMADVAQLEQINKMNARNVAMVFAPNMTQMADPLTALMYAVQVMNFLKTLIVRTLKEREDILIDTASASQLDPSDESGHNSSCEPVFDNDMDNSEPEKTFLTKEPTIWSPGSSPLENSSTGKEHHSFLASVDSIISGGNWSFADSCPCEVVSHVANFLNGHQQGSSTALTRGQTSSHMCIGSRKINDLLTVQPAAAPAEKGKGTVIISRINSRKELVEAWR